MRVAAVISTFEPDVDFLETCAAVATQVDHVVIVDDGSPSLRTAPDGPVAEVLDTCRALGHEVVRSSENRGIADALNCGIRLALDQGADLVLTLDQDTVVAPDYLDRVRAQHAVAQSRGVDTTILVPDKINGAVAPYWRSHRGMRKAFEPIQSGMVFSRAVLDIVGFLDEGLFIDCVDIEFHLRARSKGVPALVVPGAEIAHSTGSVTSWTAPRLVRRLTFGRVRRVAFAQDAPFRHYYIARNTVILYRRYWRTEPLWCVVWFVKDVLRRGRAILIGSERRSRIYLSASGLRAGLRGERGRIPQRVLRRARVIGGRRRAPASDHHARTVPRTPELVSVVIPVRDAVDLIDGQLSALAQQEISARFEVVVSDNGSRDGLRDHIESHPLRERLGLRWVDAGTRPGAAFARNEGVRAASGDLLVFCDADDQVLPGWLDALVAAAGRHSAVDGAVEVSTLNSEAVRRWRPVRPPTQPSEIRRFVRVLGGNNCAVWREDFERVGGFDEAYVRGYEDADLGIRIQLAGGSVGHTPAARVAYRLRDTPSGIWQQSVTYGRGEVQLYSDYRHYGMPRSPLWSLLDVTLFLALRNPLLPEKVTGVPLGRWLYQAGQLAGRVRGSVEQRVFYV